jgi:hypothetical protein
MGPGALLLLLLLGLLRLLLPGSGVLEAPAGAAGAAAARFLPLQSV